MVKVVVECALVFKKRSRMLATRLTVVVVFFFVVKFFSEIVRRVKKDKRRDGGENVYIKGSTFVRSLQTNMFKRYTLSPKAKKNHTARS